MRLRHDIDSHFRRWGAFVTRHPRATIAFALAFAVALSLELPSIVIDGSSEAFLHENDPVRVRYDEHRAEFGRDRLVIIAAEPTQVFDLHFLETLRSLHADLERIREVRKVTSLINARHVHGTDDALIVDSLEVDWPEDETDLRRIEARIRSHPYYRNYLISSDGRAVGLIVELHTYSPSVWRHRHAGGTLDGRNRQLLTPRESQAAVEKIRSTLARYQAPDLELSVTGGPFVETDLLGAMQRDIIKFCSLSVLTIVLLLFLIFRRLSGIVLPLLTVLLSLLCTLGAMAAAGVAITLPIQVLPSFLIAVGLCDSIHLLVVFFHHLGEQKSKNAAIVYAIERTGTPIVMTSLTTAGGLASFATADLMPLMHFGIFGPTGVALALLFTLSLLPALLAILPLSASAPSARSGPSYADRALRRFGMVATHRPSLVLAVSSCMLLVAAVGAARLRFSHHTLKWLPESMPIRADTERFDRLFQGSFMIEAVIETGLENGVHEPKLLKALDELRVYAESFERGAFRIGKTLSVADVLKEINQAVHANRPEYSDVPSERALIAQEFVLFENSGSDDVDDLVDLRFSKACFILRLPDMDAMDALPIIDEIAAHFRSVLPEGVSVTLTGGGIVLARTLTAAVRSMAYSYAVAFLLVTPLMALLLRSLGWGLVAMIPNLTPVVLTLGLMGWLGVPLDFSTMMIAAIVLGLAVDDTIHFMHNYRFHYRQTNDAKLSVERTLRSTGRAMLFTTLVLSIGFLVYTQATMANLVTLGAFGTFAIAIAFLADVTLAPALVVTLSDRLPRLAHSRSVGTVLPQTDRPWARWSVVAGVLVLALALLAVSGTLRKARGSEIQTTQEASARPFRPRSPERIRPPPPLHRRFAAPQALDQGAAPRSRREAALIDTRGSSSRNPRRPAVTRATGGLISIEADRSGRFTRP